MTDQHSMGLGGSTTFQALLHQNWIIHKTGGLMGSQSACTNQNSITPNKSLLQNAPITTTTEMRCTALGKGQATVKTDGEYESDGRTA